MKEQYSPKKVAQALNVSESSVKRWCDLGAISVVKTVGGHRRVTRDALNEFLKNENRELVNPEALGTRGDKDLTHHGSVRLDAIKDANEILSRAPMGIASSLGFDPEMIVRFSEALIADDEIGCERIITSLRERGFSIANLGDQLICPALRKLGDDWSCSRIDIYQERRACEILVKLIQKLTPRQTSLNTGGLVAMGASPSNDPYALPGHIIEAMLSELGWKARNLGVDIPFESLLRAIAREHPDLFWLSVSTIADESSFIAELAKFRDSLPMTTRLVVGGRAMTPAIRSRFPKLSFCDSLEQLRGYARAIEAFGH